MTPDQLAHYLEVRGLADTDGIRRKATLRNCPWCLAPTIQGLDGDVAGLPVTTDVIDLDRLAEAACVLAGLRTYTIFEFPDGLRIHPRHAPELRAEKQDRPVVRGHFCNVPCPTSTANRWKAPRHNPTLHTDTPPF